MQAYCPERVSPRCIFQALENFCSSANRICHHCKRSLRALDCGFIILELIDPFLRRFMDMQFFDDGIAFVEDDYHWFLWATKSEVLKRIGNSYFLQSRRAVW